LIQLLSHDTAQYHDSCTFYASYTIKSSISAKDMNAGYFARKILAQICLSIKLAPLDKSIISKGE
jgi:hypothetical protein